MTVAIPTYRRASLLRRTIESVLSQSYQGDLEVLVVENPSAETSASSHAAEICRSMNDSRIRYICNERNLGMTGNWNRCMELARGSWILILHDDDWIASGYLSAVTSVIKEHPNVALIGCDAIFERKDGDVTQDLPLPLSLNAIRLSVADLWLNNPMMASGVCMCRETALALGGFDQDWYPSMDHAFWQKFILTNVCVKIEHPLLHYYLGENTSLDPEVLGSFIVNNWRLRRELKEEALCGKSLLSWYARARPSHERSNLSGFYRVPLRWERVHERLLEAGWKPVPFLMRWTYYPIVLVLRIWSVLSRERLVSAPCDN